MQQQILGEVKPVTCKAARPSCLEDVGNRSNKEGQSASWPSNRHAKCADSTISQRTCALLGTCRSQQTQVIDLPDVEEMRV